MLGWTFHLTQICEFKQGKQSLLVMNGATALFPDPHGDSPPQPPTQRTTPSIVTTAHESTRRLYTLLLPRGKPPRHHPHTHDVHASQPRFGDSGLKKKNASTSDQHVIWRLTRWGSIQSESCETCSCIHCGSMPLSSVRPYVREKMDGPG
jgi:hypothetical protein